MSVGIEINNPTLEDSLRYCKALERIRDGENGMYFSAEYCREIAREALQSTQPAPEVRCPACADGQCNRCANDGICECECRALSSSNEDIRYACINADWGQVVSNGGPPCFRLFGKKFCLRAERWAGHGIDHDFVSLLDMSDTAQATIRELGQRVKELREALKPSWEIARATRARGLTVSRHIESLERAYEVGEPTQIEGPSIPCTHPMGLTTCGYAEHDRIHKEDGGCAGYHVYESIAPPPVCGTCGGTKRLYAGQGGWGPCPECTKESAE